MKRTVALGGIVTAGGLLAVSLTAPAQAASPDPKPDVASANLAGDAVAAKNIVAFWYAENAANLINATPYKVETKAVTTQVVSKGGPAASGKPGLVPAIGDEKKAGASKNVNLPRSTGKVFFLGSDDRPHWCSATSVQAQYRNLVATAGHCVYDTESNKATLKYWVFVPGYYQGKTPWGIYVGKQAFTHYDYSVYEDGDRDYAFVTVYNGLKLPAGGFKDVEDLIHQHKWDQLKDYVKVKEVDEATYDAYARGDSDHDGWGYWKGEDDQGHTHYYVLRFHDVGRLGNNVGGQGLAYNQKLGRYVYVFGYPSGSHPDGNHAFTGKTLKWSYGKTFAARSKDLKAEQLVAVRSAFTGEGALGSAWVSGYSNSHRLGYLNGVTIGVSDTDKNKRFDTSLSPYFDGETYQVYSAAKNRWSGSIA
ncbi:serine protease [Planotetraspora sp. GP83]|uniref:trypsin-like serine peptidase n=1 Tax=Planotetraspora sp. GP83 TaxID=3156264 RepID=UPI0035112090